MELTGKVRKALSNNMWYHGTTYNHWESFCEKSVIANINTNKAHELDFGYGFYLAPSAERAESFIRGMVENSGFYSDDEHLMILGFEFSPLALFESDEIKTKIFPKYDDDFANFVFDNRTENIRGRYQHHYDIIYGVMSDAVPTLAISQYRIGEKTREEVIETLKTSTSMKQMSLHTQKICDILILKEAYIINRKTNERKELNVDDYNCK